MQAKPPVPLSSLKCIEWPLEGLIFFEFILHGCTFIFTCLPKDLQTWPLNFMRLCLSKNSDFIILGVMFKCSVKP